MSSRVKEGFKPECKLLGENGNIFNLIGKATNTLKKYQMPDKAKELQEKCWKAGSYDEALSIIMDYVDVV